MAVREKCGWPPNEITTNNRDACVATRDLIKCTVWPRVWRHWTSSMNSVAAMCGDTRARTIRAACVATLEPMTNRFPCVATLDVINEQWGRYVWRHWSAYN